MWNVFRILLTSFLCFDKKIKKWIAPCETCSSASSFCRWSTSGKTETSALSTHPWETVNQCDSFMRILGRGLHIQVWLEVGGCWKTHLLVAVEGSTPTVLLSPRSCSHGPVLSDMSEPSAPAVLGRYRSKSLREASCWHACIVFCCMLTCGCGNGQGGELVVSTMPHSIKKSSRLNPVLGFRRRQSCSWVCCWFICCSSPHWPQMINAYIVYKSCDLNTKTVFSASLLKWRKFLRRCIHVFWAVKVLECQQCWQTEQFD